MVENVDRRPDIESLIKQTKERQRFLISSRSEIILEDIIVLMAYGAYILGLEVGAGLRPDVDVGRIRREDLLPKELK